MKANKKIQKYRLLKIGEFIQIGDERCSPIWGWTKIIAGDWISIGRIINPKMIKYRRIIKK